MLILNGQVLEAGAPEITLLNRSFKYGDSLFETIRVYQGKALFLLYHLERLTAGMKVLKFQFSKESFQDHIREEIDRLLALNQVSNHGYIRLQVYRSGAGAYTPIQHEPYYLMEAQSFKDDPFQAPSSLQIVAYRELGLRYDVVSRFKTGNALPYVLAGIYAREQGADDAVLFQDKEVADTAGANLFIVKQQKLFTPPIESGCLDGVMRRQLFLLCQELRVPLQAKKLKHKDLLQADEIFLTNSVRGIMPVSRYEDVVWEGDAPLTQFLRKCLRQYVEGKIKA
ncbi:MAG: aminotransferase class IV [Bacteroidota bacterium]